MRNLHCLFLSLIAEVRPRFDLVRKSRSAIAELFCVCTELKARCGSCASCASLLIVQKGCRGELFSKCYSCPPLENTCFFWPMNFYQHNNTTYWTQHLQLTHFCCQIVWLISTGLWTTGIKIMDWKLSCLSNELLSSSKTRFSYKNIVTTPRDTRINSVLKLALCFKYCILCNKIYKWNKICEYNV